MRVNCLIFLIQIFYAGTSIGQAGMWTWIKGNSPAVFGTMGVSSPLNNPEPVYEGCEWKDLNGNFWVFGTAFGQTNTLWKYDPVTNEWTWMNGSQMVNDPGNYGVMGVPSPLNQPRGRGFGCLSWVDNNNNLWMYGGCTVGGSNNHDLWKYDISTNEWTWMNGSQLYFVPANYGTMGVPDPANFPGGRYESNATWTDASGLLWFFGGGFFDGNSTFHTRNDLWTYNTNTNEWTWMNGPTTADDPGNYGVKGVSSPTNLPPARACYTKFESNAGAYYIFGGILTSVTALNDLWKYDKTSGEWTWMTGSQYGTGSPSYGNVCDMDSNTTPDNLWENRACWTDQYGNFWNFGGTNNSNWNDLWKYCPATNEWAFIRGSMMPGAAINYGTMGVASPTNDPGARNGSHAWYDGNHKLYLFSGYNMQNDLWTYEIDDSCAICNSSALPTAIFTAPNQICPGTCTNFINLSTNGNSFLWSFPGATPSTSSDVSPANICYNTPGSYPVTLIATNANGSDTLTLNNFITVYPYPSPQGISQSGDTLFANAGAVSYQWYHDGVLIPGATDYYYVASAGGNYNIVATDLNGCEVEAAIFDVVASVQYPGTENNIINSVTIYPNPAGNNLFISCLKDDAVKTEDMILNIYRATGDKILSIYLPGPGSGKQNDRLTASIDIHSLSNGIYCIELLGGEKIFRARFIKDSSN